MEDTPRTEMMLTRHWAAIALALLFGLALAGPYLVIRADPAFVGLYPEIQNDQNFYLSRIQDVRDGYPESGNSYTTEGKSALAMQFLTGERVIAVMLDILHLPTKDGLIVFQFIFPPLIFLLTYAVFLRLRASRFWALMGTVLLTFGIFFFAFARIISPQFNFIFWLGAALGMLWMGERPGWRWVALQSLITGILFYLYPYYWTHLLAAYGLLFLAYLIINRARALQILVVIGGAVVVGSGYLSLVLNARTLPDYQESLSRLGFVATHSPSGASLIAVAAIVIGITAFLVWKKRVEVLYDPRLVATFALLLGGVIAMNQHIVTGINMEFSSHYAMQIVFAAAFLVASALMIGHQSERFNKTWLQGAAAVLIAAMAMHTMLPTYALAKRSLAEHPEYRDYATLIEWFNGHTESGATIFAPDEFSSIVPAYTPENVWYARDANIAFMSDDEVIDRFIIQNYRAEFDRAFITSYERALFGQRYLNAYNHARQKDKFLKLVGITVDVPDRLPQSAVEAVEARAKELKSEPFAKALASYRADYIVIDTASPDGPTAADLTPLTPIFTAGPYQVFDRPMVR